MPKGYSRHNQGSWRHSVETKNVISLQKLGLILTKTNKICPHCGCKFITSAQSQSGGNKFCSLSCSSSFNNKGRSHDYMKGEKNPAKRPEVKAKMSRATRGRNCWWWKGEKRPEHSKFMKKYRVTNPGNFLSGESSPFWNGGTSNEPYSFEFNSALKIQVKARDGYLCQLCGCSNPTKLTIHHIDYDKKNHLLANLIALCRSCNAKANFNRPYWAIFFADKIRGEGKKECLK